MNLWQQWRARLHHGIKPDIEANAYLRQLMASLLAMAWFVEARDPYTGGHLWRVSRYARLLAEETGLPAAEVAQVSVGGFLHDLGKIGVPDAVLRKPSRLTEEEYAVIKTHPDLGLRMLARHPLAAFVGDAVGMHHERPDGLGYPNGLTTENIPVAARIVGICDAFDAMTTALPHGYVTRCSTVDSGAGGGEAVRQPTGGDFSDTWPCRTVRSCDGAQ